ncbi:MAG: GNAT family acetyltransferase [Chloroflexota bacterium]
MKIRPFQESDQAAVIDLWKACGLVVPWNDPAKDIARKLKVDPDLFLVGVLDDTIIASVMGGYEGHRGWINYLAVSPDHQRKAYGHAMMDAVEARIKAKGCPKINLQIRSSNTQVIAFYQALGYVEDKVVSFGKRLESDE